MPSILAGHGPNLGHTWTKYVIIGADGRELPPVCFPSVIASAGRQVAGALVNAPTWRGLAGRWAVPGTDYADKVAGLATLLGGLPC